MAIVVACAPASISQAVAQNSSLSYHAETGKVRFISSAAVSPVHAVEGMQNRLPGSAEAGDLLRRYAPLFGIDNPDRDLQASKTSRLADRRSIARYRQRHRGLPVIAGELVVNRDAAGRMLSMNGEISPNLEVDTVPKLSASDAHDIAIRAVAKWHSVDTSLLRARLPVLSVYDPRLLTPGDRPVRLVWHTEVEHRDKGPVSEFVLIDANRGVISLHFNQIHSARSRETYTAGGTDPRPDPGTLVCNESEPNCTSGGNPDADAAHIFAGNTYDFFQSRHGRDGIDDAGMTIVSTVDWDDGISCPNAFWDGSQMTYCDGFPLADDVVAHELTHGVTENSSDLLYYYQSGAINESLSDMWGEFVDLTNGGGTDSPAVRWLVGEDLPGSGAIRDMQDPGEFGDPDRMGSPEYFTGSGDNGGVHINSGINNKAASLMVDGGSFNGFTVDALGVDKTSTVYYEAQTNLLTSGSDYADLFDAINQACQNVIGSVGITDDDCIQVRNALLAVEMDDGNLPLLHPEAEVCPAGTIRSARLFYDDMENGTGSWTFGTLTGDNSWINANVRFATSGTNVLFDTPSSVLADHVVAIKNDIVLPTGSQAYMHFRHAYSFEISLIGAVAYDGGFFEYSTDGGANWNDAGPLIDDGSSYNGAITDFGSPPNPNHGQAAFVGESLGFVSTRVSLASLVGQSVRFRWRSSYDPAFATDGWLVDDVQFYTCNTGDNQTPIADANVDQFKNATKPVNLDGTGSSDPDGDTLTFGWSQSLGPTVALDNPTSATPGFTAPAVSAQLRFTLTVDDNAGATHSDTVDVTIDGPPQANAGPDQKVTVGAQINLSGADSSDVETESLIYTWTQTLGPTVVLNGASSSTPSFTAPGSATLLAFSLAVTDSQGQTGLATVIVTVESAGDDIVESDDDGGSSSLNAVALFVLALFALMARSIPEGTRQPGRAPRDDKVK